MAVIRVDDLGKRYRLFLEKSALVNNLRSLGSRRRFHEDFWALRHIGFEVEAGEMLGLIGANGSGKSTLLRLLGGITLPEEGRLTCEGTVTGLYELGAGFQPDLTGRENLLFGGILHGYSQREITQQLEEIIAFAELGDFIDAPLHTYSTGMWMRLAFALAIHIRSDVLLVDEVLSVGDAAFQAKCFARLQALQARRTTIVWATHDLARVRTLCHRALWLRQGQVCALGPSATVVDAYQQAA